MKRSALVVALLALALTACGEKAAETAPAAAPAPAVVAAPAVADTAASAVVDAAASAVGGAPAASEVVAAPADAMKK